MINWFTNSWKKYYTPTYRILAFIVGIALVTYLLPKTSKFRYEYIKGKPWKHQTLIAPFDFPIYKNQQELKQEKDSLSVSFRPYFFYEESPVEAKQNLLHADYTKKLSTFQKQYPELFESNHSNTGLQEKLISTVDQSLATIYNKGIISLPEEYIDAPPTFELMLIIGSIAEPYGLSEFYSFKSGYQYIINQSLQQIPPTDTIIYEQARNFLSDLQLNKYLSANVTYNNARTTQEKQNLLKKISLTSGKVMAGQKVIDTGDLINDDLIKILDSLKREYESRIGSISAYYLIIVAQAIIVLLLFITIYLFLYYFRRDVYDNLLSVSFILFMVITMIALASIVNYLDDFPLLIIPFAILPIIVRIFFDSRLAFFLYIITILLAAFFAENSFLFVFLQIPVGLVAIFALFRMVRRSQLVRAAVFIIITYALFYSGISLWQEGDITKIDPFVYAQFTINGALILLVYPLIDIFERLFGFLSDVTLVELSDTNHPILRKLAEKAPGTFQHSIQVGNLAQEVAYAIEANPMLVRAGAMYHDIGKMASPMFFTENQTSGINPHNELPYEESAQIVINHIESGIKLAKKDKVPEQIIDFIRTHQGTTTTRYFYTSFMNKYPEKMVDISVFSYPGPTPFTKETAILMMADSIEAASRSLKNYTDHDIDKLVENIINTQIKEDQFINAPITFREITKAKEVFKQKLKNIYHARIEYPKLKKRH
ncbi:HDIG domain-containing protein [Marinilabiliaceae bacterium JC017]|nr:HDIG domain-containing protein [Marinilabiliaceae bacterium JC017]